MCLQWEPLQSAFSCSACVQALIWWSEHACLVYCRCRIIPHYTLTRSAAASLPFPSLPAIEDPSTPPFLSPSLPPSPAGLYLPAALRGNHRSSVTLSSSTAMLRFALPVEHKHTRTHRCGVDMARVSVSSQSFVKSISLWSWRCVSLCRQPSWTEDDSFFILNES